MSSTTSNAPVKRHKTISYAGWGYFFIAPFIIVYIFCSLLPLLSTFYNSLFENYLDGLKQIGPNFIGFDNFVTLFTPRSDGKIEIFNNTANTIIMWIMGAVPQIVFALLLAVIFTSERLKIKGQGFFKTVIYMPNLIMASAFSMLFFQIFGAIGPINQIITANGGEAILFFNEEWSARSIIAFINFLMWFGNTTILLMAGIMGIDQSLFEAAAIDGANSGQVFFKITLPLLMPILIYVVITALIGGLQMFDVPQIITNGNGAPNGTTRTLVMSLNQHIGLSKNYGMAGALSVILFIITGILSFVVFRTTEPKKEKKGGKK
ncbi:MAG: sugar ABC transporter permease [Ruminiclostridium sp.]|nr:sugar ABC transporter permease [Ruminiclostridium sp.]